MNDHFLVMEVEDETLPLLWWIEHPDACPHYEHEVFQDQIEKPIFTYTVYECVFEDVINWNGREAFANFDDVKDPGKYKIEWIIEFAGSNEVEFVGINILEKIDEN